MTADISPILFFLLLAGAVATDLPAVALVFLAGSLYGFSAGLSIVLAAEAVGLVLNWQLCRGLLRPRVTRWLQTMQRGEWIRPALNQPIKLKTLVLIRLSLIPTTIVNAVAALGPTSGLTYGIASLTLIPRFALIVKAGVLSEELIISSTHTGTPLLRLISFTATCLLLILLAKRLIRLQ
jgi:uncharacterized membrane protein YdjX (TVP38/TMEM64 family)